MALKQLSNLVEILYKIENQKSLVSANPVTQLTKREKLKTFMQIKARPTLSQFQTQRLIEDVMARVMAVEINQKDPLGKELLSALSEVIFDKTLSTFKKNLGDFKEEFKGEKGEKGDSVKGDRGVVGPIGETMVVEKIIERTEVIKEQPIVTQEIKEVAVTDPAEDIRNKLELLTEDERLDKSAIKGLEEDLEELRRMSRTATGGGVTNLRIQQAFKYILKTEAPVGLINGSNTTYTVSQPIFAVLAFSISNAVITQLPNYTISGNTITFAVALPSAYSNRDFECKYI